MSFIIQYSTRRDPEVLKLTGFVGKDRNIYYSFRDVVNLFGREPAFPWTLTFIRLLDVTGFKPPKDPYYGIHMGILEERVVSHKELSEVVKQSIRFEVKDLGRKLNNPKTRIQIIQEHDLTQLYRPTVIKILEDPKDDFIFLSKWAEFFKQRALKDFYKKPTTRTIEMKGYNVHFPDLLYVRIGSKKVCYQVVTEETVPKRSVASGTDDDQLLG